MIKSGLKGTASNELGRLAAQIRTGATGAALLGLAFAGPEIRADNLLALSLVNLSLEQLAQLQVTTVSKTARPVSGAPASVFVITENDIHRSGATNLPEALRLAPNLQVARLNASSYAVSARGFNNAFANKMLVMIDGRSIYSPLHSGVQWDAQGTVLEDIDRIEAISGPGGTLWGANAVNGVISILTKPATETQGFLQSIGGSGDEFRTAVRYGGEAFADGHYRVYAQYNRVRDTRTASGAFTETGARTGHTGFRADWSDGGDTLTVQGDAYTGQIQQINTDDVEVVGGNILARATRELSDISTLSLQAYFDHSQRDWPTRLAQRLNIADLEVQHEWQGLDGHTLVWGGGYRYAADRISNREMEAFLPDDVNQQWRSLFIQDEVQLSDELRLIVGTKLEDDPYSGWDHLPSAQLAWMPQHDRLIWASLSRSIRSPARIDRDYFLPGNPPYVLAGGPNFGSETADVAEIGYRHQPDPHLSYSLTAFYSEYRDLRTLERQADSGQLQFENLADAVTFGLEAWGSWQVADDWRLHGGFVLQEIDFDPRPGSNDFSPGTALAIDDPEHHWQLRSSYDVRDDIALDVTLRHVAQLESADVPAYTALNLRLGWSLHPQVEVSLLGLNLLDHSHSEFGPLTERSEYERALYAEVVWTL